MTVTLSLTTGEKLRLDRNYRIDQIAAMINEARGGDELIALLNNSTPPRYLRVDPAAVVAITDDGKPY